jgi:hypothetical protein
MTIGGVIWWANPHLLMELAMAACNNRCRLCRNNLVCRTNMAEQHAAAAAAADVITTQLLSVC